MAYIPQFIPTNTQVLQGTLDQYQKGYDTETARMNQANDLYSAIPTTNVNDTAAKNALMSKFQQEVIGGLDKKYNFDRSNTQYAKELASEIGKLRNDSLWSLINQRSEIDKVRQNVKQSRGANYYENFNPDTISDPEQLKQWQSLDKKTLLDTVGKIASEHANAKTRPISRMIAPGLMEVGTQFGYADDREMEQFLASKPGEAWLAKSVEGTGFEQYMNDPEIRSAAINAARANLIGKPVTTFRTVDDGTGTTKKSGSGGDGPMIPLVESQSIRETSNFKYNSLDSVSKDSTDPLNRPVPPVKEMVKNTRFGTTGVAMLSGAVANKRRDNLARNISNPLELDRTIAVQKEIESSGDSFKILERGNNSLGNILNSSPTYNKLSDIQKEATRENIFTNLKNDLNFGYVNNTVSGIEKELEKKFPDINFTRAQVRDFKNWYNSDGEYVGDNVGYSKTKKIINDRLSKGESTDATELVVDASVNSAGYNNAKRFILDSAEGLQGIGSDVNQGSSKEWSDEGLTKVQEWLSKSDEPVSMSFILNTEGMPSIQVTKGSEKIKLQPRPGRSGEAIFDRFADMTGDERFRSYGLADIKLAPNTPYDLSNKSFKKVLSNSLGLDEKEIEDRLSGLTFNRKEDNSTGKITYEIKFPKYAKELESKPWIKDGITSKQEAFGVLSLLAKYKDIEITETAKLNNKAERLDPTINLGGTRNIDEFVNAMAIKESGGNWGTIQQDSSALGAYQFMPNTLRGLGYPIDSEGAINEFLNNPALQTEYMYKLMSQNADLINRENNVNIDINNLTNESKVLLAAAHYGGYTKAKMLINNINDSELTKPQPARDKNHKIIYGKDGKPVRYYPSVIKDLEKITGIDLKSLDFSTLRR